MFKAVAILALAYFASAEIIFKEEFTDGMFFFYRLFSMYFVCDHFLPSI